MLNKIANKLTLAALILMISAAVMADQLSDWQAIKDAPTATSAQRAKKDTLKKAYLSKYGVPFDENNPPTQLQDITADPRYQDLVALKVQSLNLKQVTDALAELASLQKDLATFGLSALPSELVKIQTDLNARKTELEKPTLEQDVNYIALLALDVTSLKTVKEVDDQLIIVEALQLNYKTSTPALDAKKTELETRKTEIQKAEQPTLEKDPDYLALLALDVNSLTTVDDVVSALTMLQGLQYRYKKSTTDLDTIKTALDARKTALEKAAQTPIEQDADYIYLTNLDVKQLTSIAAIDAALGKLQSLEIAYDLSDTNLPTALATIKTALEAQKKSLEAPRVEDNPDYTYLLNLVGHTDTLTSIPEVNAALTKLNQLEQSYGTQSALTGLQKQLEGQRAKLEEDARPKGDYGAATEVFNAANEQLKATLQAAYAVTPKMAQDMQDDFISTMRAVTGK